MPAATVLVCKAGADVLPAAVDEVATGDVEVLAEVLGVLDLSCPPDPDVVLEHPASAAAHISTNNILGSNCRSTIGVLPAPGIA